MIFFKIKKRLLIYFLLGIVFLANCKCVNMMEKKVKYTYNPDLEIIKEDWKGNIMIDGIFCNGLKKDEAPIWKVVKWKLTRNPQSKEKKNSKYKIDADIDTLFQQNEQDIAIWLGHSSFFLRLDGFTYLIDPIFSDLPTSKRKVLNPYTVSALGQIDYVLISHGHFDHFDLPSLKDIVKNNPDVEILGPLGMKLLLGDLEFKTTKIQEAGWFQRFNTKGKNEIIYLPAKHWHRRGLFDFNKVLWGGFGIKSKKAKIYFAGDTAKDIDIFKQIDNIYDGFDFCMIPIGSYAPQFLMKDEHVNPKEALELFNTLQGRYFIPMHYATFDLSDEPLGEPIALLNENVGEANISNKLLELKIGQILYLDMYLNDSVNNKCNL